MRSYIAGGVAGAVCGALGDGLALLSDGRPFVIQYLVAVAFAAWHGGRGPALATTALSIAVAEIFFVNSRISLQGTFTDHVRLALMVGVGVAISGLAGSLHAARAAQRRETDRLNGFIRDMPAAMLVFDAAGNVVHSNAQVKAVLGHDPVSLSGNWTAYDADGQRIPREEYTSSKALRGERVSGRQMRYLRSDGRETWIEASAVPLVEDGRITGALTVFFDIGEQKRLQLELEESRRQLRVAHQSARSGSFEWDLRRQKSYWSPELEALYGMEAGSYRGTHEEWARRIHPEDLPRVEREIQEALTGGSLISQWRVVMPDGSVRHIEAQGRTAFDDDGRPMRLAGVNIDVTERLEAERRVGEAEANLEVALAAARMGRWHLELATMEMESSTTCKANFGRMPHEPFTYDDLLATIHPEDLESMQSAVRRALEERRDYATEYRAIWPDGTVRWIAARGRAKYDAEGRATSMDGVTIDFTGRKRLEEDLLEKTESLRAADRRKDQFLAVLGHELRNPLAPLRNAVEILRVQGDDGRIRERALAVMERQTLQLGRLVDELLDVSRIAQGKIRLERAPVELAAVIEQAVETSEPLIASRRHTVKVELPPPGTVVDVDRARLVQVLTNLVNNAAKYTDPGGSIKVSAESAAGVAIVSVRDNGIGIAPEAIGRLFELFSQIDGSVDRSQGGLGLGLNVAKRLIEMHDGSITAHSGGAGQGSTFTITLPLAARRSPVTAAA
jgi:PAS domain S-box-containing protein